VIEIDLLREEHYKKQKKESRLTKIDLSKLDLKNIPLVKVGVGLVSVLVIFHLTLYVLGAFSISRAGALLKNYNSILPQKEEAGLLKEKSESIDKKIKAINDLMERRFEWARELKNLSDSMMPGIWLSELNYEESAGERTLAVVAKVMAGKGRVQTVKPQMEKIVTRYLVISGYATSRGEEGTALVGKFIQSLRNNASFYSNMKDIELKSIRSDLVAGQEVMNFKISCMFKSRD